MDYFSQIVDNNMKNSNLKKKSLTNAIATTVFRGFGVMLTISFKFSLLWQYF